MPKMKNVLAERVLTEGQVRDLIAAERNPRNEALLRVRYYGGLRISDGSTTSSRMATLAKLRFTARAAKLVWWG